MKRIDKNYDKHESIKAQDILNEGLEVLKDINHPNIIKLIEIKENDDYYYCIYTIKK